MGKQKKTRKFSVAKKMINIKDARMYVCVFPLLHLSYNHWYIMITHIFILSIFKTQ
jgi:hypothetical protein